jgi:threonine aldolase
MSQTIDFRSDTLTKPTPQMREAIATAEVGDDVFGEDPTVNRLQRRAAEIAGKESALFVPSGTMANQLAVRAQTRLGDEVVMEASCHIVNYEAGGMAAISGALSRQLPGKNGTITAEQIAERLRPKDDHYAPLSLVTLENTHNCAGGVVFPLPEMERIYKLSREHHFAIHIDGARIFNAAVAAGVDVSEYGRCCDTISFCFSKGLGAPVGSVLIGSRETIELAKRMRKMFGGGMRQAGLIAAGALYALENNISRLADDHQRARRLAEGLARLEHFHLPEGLPETNIILVSTDLPCGAPGVAEALSEAGISVLARNQTLMRLVTHLDIIDEHIDRAIETFRHIDRQAN